MTDMLEIMTAVTLVFDSAFGIIHTRTAGMTVNTIFEGWFLLHTQFALTAKLNSEMNSVVASIRNHRDC
jgi:hypothetical protein